MRTLAQKSFANGVVYAVTPTESGPKHPVETTDTFLPYYTKDTQTNRNSNLLEGPDFGSRNERWMIGISTLSGCPVACRFCACNAVTRKFGVLKLTAKEMVEQVRFIVKQNPTCDPNASKEFKVLFTRMGEPALNGMNVIEAMRQIHQDYPNATVAISTVGLKGHFLETLLEEARYFRPGFIQLQFSIHSTDESIRKGLIPGADLLRFEEIAEFAKRWMALPENQDRKITLNFTLVKPKGQKNFEGFDVAKLKRTFDPKHFFVKLSPLNENETSERHNLEGVVPQTNH